MLQTKTCECGATVQVEIPDEMRGRWRAMLISLGVLCDECSAKAEEAERAQAIADAEAERTERHARRVEQSGLPLALRDLEWASLDSRHPAGAVADAKAWANGDRPGLLLTGPVGAGKTFLASVAANEFLRRRRLRWASMPLLLARLGTAFSEKGRQLAVDLIMDKGALVLDDLDKSRPSEYAAEQVFAMIDGRVSEGASLLVTTNLSLDGIAEKFPDPFGDAIASRLAGHCRVHLIGGPDRRLAQAA